MDRDGLTFRILRTDAELMALKPQWDRLWAESETEYFLCHSAIVESWNTIHRPQGARLCCAIALDQDRLVGVLPMVLNRRWVWTVASTCAPHASECCDMIVKKQPGSAELAVALMRHALQSAAPDSMYFDHVPRGTHLDIAIRAIPWLRIDETWTGIEPVATLRDETDWSSYLKSLDRKYQTNVARANRRLCEQGDVTFEVVRGTSPSLIDWLFEHKRKWSDRTDKRGQWIFSELYRNYLNELWSSESGYLTFTLKLDGEIIALKLLAINTTSASFVICTYDENYRRFSPGNILDESIFKYMFDNHRAADGKLLDITFGTGSERFKTHWSRDHSIPVTSFRMATSVVGLAAIRIKEHLADLKTRLTLVPKGEPATPAL